MELVLELVAWHYPQDTVACIRSLDRGFWKDTFLREIQAKASPRYIAYLMQHAPLETLLHFLAFRQPSYYDVYWTAANPDPTVLEHFLPEMTNSQKHWALQVACETGHLVNVRRLLEVVDPSEHVGNPVFYLPLTYAVMHNKLAAVDLLLQDPRVDPSAQKNEAVRLACLWGYAEVAKRILEHPLPRRRSFLHSWIRRKTPALANLVPM